MRIRWITYLFVAATLGWSGCNLEETISLNLPDYEPEWVVECYLEPGNPYALTLIESSGYFDAPEVPFVKDALVVITHQGVADTLRYVEIPSPDPLLRLVGAYISDRQVPADYNSPFSLFIRTATGETLRSQTLIPPPLPIDSVVWRFNEDSLALVLTYLTDVPGQPNYFRRVLSRQVLDRNPLAGNIKEPDSTWQAEIDQVFVASDEFIAGRQIVFGTTFDYAKGDTLTSAIYHITEDYYRYLESVEAAITANLNPFGQPSSILSNIDGGLGIFTGYTLDQQVVVIR